MKTLLTVVLFLLSIESFSQYRVVMDVKNVKLKTDSVFLKVPLRVNFTANPCSQITEVTQLKDKSIGVQVEILHSQLGNTDRYISGIVFYEKSINNDWKEIVRFGHSPIYLESDAGSPSLKEDGFSSFSLGVKPNFDFHIECNFHYSRN